MVKVRQLLPFLVVLVFGTGASVVAQTSVPAATDRQPSDQSLSLPGSFATLTNLPPANAGRAYGTLPQPLFDFKDSDIKFSLRSLMSTLRDRGHEGWVLAAYPDPKTKRPLIGAGFSLDVQAVDHPQTDLLNPHLFVEPSSVQLWEAAGLAPERLQRILDEFDRRMKTLPTRRSRRRVRVQALKPQVTEEEATSLLRISAIQAIYNAKAYCRGFDQLSASQQMALSQLVFQMGVNLEEFVGFLGTLNAEVAPAGITLAGLPGGSGEDEHWKAVQNTLIDSQWARLYSGRASSVIAMFDPGYPDDPYGAQRRVEAILRPTAVHRHRGSAGGTVQIASYNRHAAGRSRRAGPGSRHRRRLG
jgi:hypothetical protein